MNTLGKTVPSLIDPIFLKEIMRTPVPVNVPSPHLLTNDVKKRIFEFFYCYGFGIIIVLIIIGYIWRRYTWYQGIKEQKQIVIYKEPSYVDSRPIDNDIHLLQRPIPTYKTNNINKEIRNMHLDRLERKEIRPSQSLPVRVSSKRGNRDNDNRLDNIYNQPVYQYEDDWEGSIDRGCPGPLGRNAPLRADVPDCDNFYEFYDSNDDMYN
jgi:hypothetical protein